MAVAALIGMAKKALYGAKAIAHAKAYLKSKGFRVPSNLGQLLKTATYDMSDGALPKAQQVQEAAARLSVYSIRSSDRKLGVSVDLTGDDAVTALRAIKAQSELKKSKTYAVGKRGQLARVTEDDVIGLKTNGLQNLFIPKDKIGQMSARDIAVSRLSKIADIRSEMDYINYRAPQFKSNFLAAANMDNVVPEVQAMIKDSINNMSNMQAHNMSVDMARGTLPGIRSLNDLYYNLQGEANANAKQLLHYFGYNFDSMTDDQKRGLANQFGISMSDITRQDGTVDWTRVRDEYNS